VKLQFGVFDAESADSQLSDERGNLVVAVACPCDESRIFSTKLNADDLKAEIMFGIYETLKLNENGTRAPFPTSISRSFLHNCGNCSREIASSVSIRLTAEFWESVKKSWNESALSSLYLGLIEVAIKTKGCYGQHPENYDDARNLFWAWCGKCFTKNALPESGVYFEKVCAEVRDNYSKFLETQAATPTPPKIINQRVKCKGCLEFVEVETTISVKLPTTPAEIIRVNALWNPPIVPMPFTPVYKQPPEMAGGQTGLITKRG
jgi:hypothetical protein